MTSNPVKEEAVTPLMIKAGRRVWANRKYYIPDLAELYLAMRQADPRIAEEDAARCPTCRCTNAAFFCSDGFHAPLVTRNPRIAELEAALGEARIAIDSLDEDELGQHPELGHFYRDELLANIDAVLNRKEG